MHRAPDHPRERRLPPLARRGIRVGLRPERPMKKGNLITLLLLVALGAYLAWSTLASQHHECAVDIEFRGRSNSATASAATEEEAVRNAVATACGPITGGMD